MIGFPSSWRRAAARLFAGLAGPVLLSIASEGRAAEPAAEASDLAMFQATALEKQPSIAAARASLAAAVARSESLQNMRLGGIVFARDLPIRKQQAAIGIQSYEAGVCVAEAETRYAVTYFYLANIYARQQQDVLLGAKADLDDLYKQVKGIVEGDDAAKYRRFIDKPHQSLVESYVSTLEGRRQETLEGAERALSALREAMGVGPETDVRPTQKTMPVGWVNPATTKEEVVALAIARRGEVQQTATFVQATCLEISAQGRTFLPTLRTFAAGSDIHALTVPSGVHGMEYRPGALAPEMPTMMAGSRSGRMDQATNYMARAEAVADKTRNLITLEAEDAFLRWKEERLKAEHLRKAADDAEVYSRFMIKRFRDAVQSKFVVPEPTREPPATRIEEVMIAGATSVRMRIDANRAYFEYLLTLATLERVTCGGFRVEFHPAPEKK